MVPTGVHHGCPIDIIDFALDRVACQGLLSEVIKRAQSESQTITRNVRPSVVMVAVEEWNRKTARQWSLAAFLLRSPLAGSELTDERLDDTPRDLAL